MALGQLDGNKLVLELTEKEEQELELGQETEFEIVKAKKGVWVLLETPKKVLPKIDEAEQKIIGLLLKKDLKERVEGEFERLLSPSEQIKLQKMVAEKKVEKFRLNEKYKKAIYQLTEKEAGAKKNFEQKEKPPEEYTLEEDGFTIAKTEFAAQQISSRIADRIKSGEIKGTRSFSGEFFIIDTGLLVQKTTPVLALLKAKKNASIEELKAALNIQATLIKIVCAFLSEDGLILEKRKEQYSFIE